jgi:hypothetical protein
MIDMAHSTSSSFGLEDAYAATVGRVLVSRGIKKTAALRMINEHERQVREGFRKGTSHERMADILASHERSALVSLAKGSTGIATGKKLSRKFSAPRMSRRSRKADLGPAALEAIKLEARAPVKLITRRSKAGSSRALSGMVSGDACGASPNWQPAIFGEDLSEDALETIASEPLASLEAFYEYDRVATSLPLIHQYFYGPAKAQKSRMRMPGALYTESTGNTKVIGGPNYIARRANDRKFAAATYASISSSCPDECTLRDNGCYAQTGKTSMVIQKLDKEAREYQLDSVMTAASEAYSIYTSHKGGPVANTLKQQRGYLRVHVGGDSQTIPGTIMIADAVVDWMNRGGVKAWSYTHAWQKVPRKNWGVVSTLASIDDPAREIAAAKQQGYAPAIVVDSFGPLTSVVATGRRQVLDKKGRPKFNKDGEPVTETVYSITDYELFKKEYMHRRKHVPFAGDNTGTVYIPCPAQVEEFVLTDAEVREAAKQGIDVSQLDPKLGKKAGKGCLDCRLCFNDQEFLKPNNLGIMFEAHGPKSKLALQVLGQKRQNAPRPTGE